MRVLACDGIHEDGLDLFRKAGWTVETSEPIKDPKALAQKLAGFDAVLVKLQGGQPEIVAQAKVTAD